MSPRTSPSTTSSDPNTWVLRGLALLLFVLVAAVVWFTNVFLTERFTETTRQRAEVRLTLYSSNLLSELQQSAIVPQLLARDPALIGALNSGDFSQSSQRLLSFVDEIGAASLMLLDLDGRAVAATDRARLGETHRSNAYFVDALRASGTVFTLEPRETNGFEFTYTRRVEFAGEPVGVIVVEVDLAELERTWAGVSDAVFVTDGAGTIILSSENRWRGLEEAEALRRESPPNAIERAIRATQDWTALPPEAYIGGDAVMRMERRVEFRGWKITSFTTYASVRERVNGVLALEIMGFAILLAGIFWLSSRKTASRLLFFQRESADLRALNERLQQEIAEREKAEKNLEVAEQTVAQTSKLAALGEMSAAVSHELNQPLAAMKTYLAGAKLLLQRKRPEEALSSFQRIDDLIERMGAITRQLKSYARKGGDAFEPLDTRVAVSSALSMMEPQLKQRRLAITKVLPFRPVMIMGDRLRLEQVIINLLRNALDATKGLEDPKIDIILAAGETATLTVRDNGQGIDDLDNLFEPFYTTKQPGDGVGLGLAISSGIVNDLNGRLTARNGQLGGAVFEVQLPILDQDSDDARHAAE
jgi:two-component system, NtrC family, C4-dicarboxylate transport sensor histidine kinase DctB